MRSRWAPPPDLGTWNRVRTIVNIPAFEFDELRLDWGDVVLAAVGWGEWQLLERSLAEGLAGADAAEHGDDQLDAEWLRAAVVTFRRARGLVAGDDYLAWLSERSLSPADLEAHLRRAGLRERAHAPLGGVHGSDRADAARVTMAIRAEAILSGSLRAWAERLARCAAAARGLATGADEPPGVAAGADASLAAAAARCPSSGLTPAGALRRATAVTALLAAERAFFDRVITGERIERCLAQHGLGWQRFVWEEVAFASEGAAREASLLVRSDGMTLGEAAAWPAQSLRSGRPMRMTCPSSRGCLRRPRRASWSGRSRRGLAPRAAARARAPGRFRPELVRGRRRDPGGRPRASSRGTGGVAWPPLSWPAAPRRGRRGRGAAAARCSLPEELRTLVVESFVPLRFAFGETIFAAGDAPDGFYVLTSGSPACS